MVKRYSVELTEGELGELRGLVSRGSAAAYKQTHARIQLLSDENQDEGPMMGEIARVLRVGTATVERVRRRCVEEGVEAALSRRRRLKRRPRKLDGSGEAHLIALACSQPLEGRVSWTLQLLADGLVERKIVASISADTAGRTLKKPTQALAEGVLCIPTQANAEFICTMEDVLEVYHRAYEDGEVLVCLDESSKQQVKETRLPHPARLGGPACYDYEYQRNGVSNLFMQFAPLEGWLRVEGTDWHTKVDWAGVVRKLVDEDYPDKEKIVLVMDNLDTHHTASLYKAFDPAEAQRIAEKLEIRYTPKHGS